MLRRSPLAALSLIVAAALAFAACRSSSTSDQTPTPAHSAAPSSTATTAPSPGPSPTPSQAIRTIDLSATAAVQKVIADSNGQFVASEVIYADLTGDGTEAAIVPISSGGTMGDIAVVVLGAVGGGTRTLLSDYPRSGRGMAVAVVGHKLVITEPVPGPDDPECCPTQLRKTTYSWNGVALVAESIATVPNPDAGPKATPGGASTP